MMYDVEWAEFQKLVELVWERKAKSIETTIGKYNVKIYRVITTVRIDLQEAK